MNEFAFSVGGTTLISLTGVPRSRSQFTYFDRQGRRLGTIGAEGDYAAFDITPRGDRVVVSVMNTSQSLWVLEPERTEARRLTFDDQLDVDPNITTSGDVYFVRRNGSLGLHRISIDGGAEQQATSHPAYSLDDVSRDGKIVIYRRGATSREAWLASSSGEEGHVVARAKAPVDQVHLSPDARWIAYNTAEADRQEIYIVPTNETGGIWNVSNGGGVQPVWAPDGRTLYYLGLEGTLYAVNIEANDQSVKPGPPKALFKSPLTVVANVEQYRVTADGQRFVFKVPLGIDIQPALRVVLNWPMLFERRQEEVRAASK